jgi:hypothetical protein
LRIIPKEAQNFTNNKDSLKLPYTNEDREHAMSIQSSLYPI